MWDAFSLRDLTPCKSHRSGETGEGGSNNVGKRRMYSNVSFRQGCDPTKDSDGLKNPCPPTAGLDRPGKKV